ncbi:glutathione S-transferase T3-like [Salvia miltiorrhiza]|uniref:glutathione S-transferase T3-like n=1 Tax=Salvia miltiorrhiza TaxID=226208 RepID=UPI0025AB6ADD|nr:glutathione S-transferase T3-like [Salvia miltiorrhiza]
MDREFDEYMEQQGGSRVPMMGFAPFSAASNVLATGNVPMPAANANVQEEPEEVKPKAKGTRAAYSSEETELVAILWAEATHNPILGTSKKLLQYWGAIAEKFNALNTSGAPPRKSEHLKSHFARVQKETKFFEGCYNTCKENWGSGMSDDQIFQQAQTMFEANFKKQFSYVKAWKVLRDCQRFTSQAGDVHSAKKSKGSDVYGLERAAVLVSEVTSALKELFKFYKVSHHVAPTSRPRVSASTSTSIRERRSERRSAMSLEALQESDQDCDDLDTNELTIYLTEKQYKVGKNDVDQFDILMWWSSNTARYPVLAEMARDILAVPISSVASECAFSMGGRVLSPYRSSLAPKMVEALICAEDWLRSTDIDKKDEEGVPEEEQQKEFEMVLHSYTHGDPRTAQSQTDQSGSRATETD